MIKKAFRKVTKHVTLLFRYGPVAFYERDRLISGAKRKIESGEYVELLLVLATCEARKWVTTRPIAKFFCNLMETEDGCRMLSDPLKHALARMPDSRILFHLAALVEGRLGRHKEASVFVYDELSKAKRASLADDQSRVNYLTKVWRHVDQVNREQMEASVPQAAKAANAISAVYTDAENDESEDAFASIGELLLQNRKLEAYLKLCKKEFESAQTVAGKLKAIKTMTRQGVRRVKTYEPGFDLARASLATIEPQWREMVDYRFDGSLPISHKVWLSTVASLVDVLLLLHMREALSTVLQGIEKFRNTQGLLTNAHWRTKYLEALIYHALNGVFGAAGEKEDPNTVRTPLGWDETKAFLDWALLVGDYDTSIGVFERLIGWFKTTKLALIHVNALQRRGDFLEALVVAQRVHRRLLYAPYNINPFAHFNLVRRIGELKFLVRTAEVLQSSPYPLKLEGVIFLAARNVDFLRRTPLVVLAELKKRGWVIVQVVDGLLKPESCGIPELDELQSSITLARRVRPDLRPKFVDAIPSERNFRDGELSWKGIDLSHPLWEDSAINRRCYHVDFDCTGLRNFLDKHCDWSDLIVNCLAKTHAVAAKNGLRLAVVGQLTGRLPDALMRKYCEEFGDPKTCFYVHTSNGYQNYFANFTESLSRMCVIRNMTEHSNLRSGIFPIPMLFEEFYKKNINRAEEVFAKVEAVTRVKRASQTHSGQSTTLRAVEDRIAKWRSEGGKVACAFGKVVCDSNVPYDGGWVHNSMKDWINHCVRAVRGSSTLLLVRPHPHEMNNQISTFPNEFFHDLIDEKLNSNCLFLPHGVFNMHELGSRIDLGLIYNGTSAIELGLMNIPCLLSGYFSEVDYPIGHYAPKSRSEYERMVRFEEPVPVRADLRERAALWLEYVSNAGLALPYRYVARSITNKVIYPPYWFEEDLERYLTVGDESVSQLADRFSGAAREPV
jgi:hypothetical protein